MHLIKMSVLLLGMVIAGLPLYAGKFEYGQWAKVINGPLKGKIISIRGSVKNHKDLLDDYFVSIGNGLQNYDEHSFIDVNDKIYYGVSIEDCGNFFEDIKVGYCFPEPLLKEVDQEDVRRVNDQLPFSNSQSVPFMDQISFVSNAIGCIIY